MPTPTTIPTSETWLADYGWLSANLPVNCPPQFKSRFLSLGAGIYAHAAASIATPVAAPATNGANADTVLALVQKSGAGGITAERIMQQTGMTETIAKRALVVLKGKNLINESAAGLYFAVGTGNVQGIRTGTAQRGRPRGARGKKSGAAAAA